MKLHVTMLVTLLLAQSAHTMQQQKSKPTLLRTMITMCTGLALITSPAQATTCTNEPEPFCQYAMEDKYTNLNLLLDDTEARIADEVAWTKHHYVQYFKYQEQRANNAVHIETTYNSGVIPVPLDGFNEIFTSKAPLIFDDMEPNELKRGSVFRAFVRKLATLLQRKTSQGLVVARAPVAGLEALFRLSIPAERPVCASQLYIYDFQKTTAEEATTDKETTTDIAGPVLRLFENN